MNNNINDIILKDKILLCIDCQEQFLFTVGEQRYYLSKGLSTPKRCPDCRRIRRELLVRDGGDNGN